MPPEFDLQPTLSGDRVTIRPLEAVDWPAMFAAAADPAIWVQHPASDRYQETVFRHFFADALASGSAFAFVDNATGAIIGSSRYHGLDTTTGEVEIGWTFLSRNYWGGSYNAEIKQLMLQHAFRFVKTVVFWIGESNTRSRRATEKIGAVQRDGIFDKDGAPHVVYEFHKPD